MITISDKAGQRIDSLLADRQDQAFHGLRISVAGGGCSGFMLQMELSEAHEDDKVFTHAETGARVFIDPKSVLLLGGSTVDYSDGLTDAGFKVHNPHAKDSCGCGLSFGV